jgi:hypothetical protein
VKASLVVGRWSSVVGRWPVFLGSWSLVVGVGTAANASLCSMIQWLNGAMIQWLNDSIPKVSAVIFYTEVGIVTGSMLC